jgi:outer membrane protein assembly factor BamA
VAVALTVVLASAWRSPARAIDYTIIPIPEIIVDPNEGVTGGVLPVVLFTTEEKEIRSILAPDVRYNTIFGVYPTFRFFDYPSIDQKWHVSLGKATKIQERFEGEYQIRNLADGWLDLYGRLFRDKDPTERFFGIGNDTPEADETNYTIDEYRANLVLGVNLHDDLQVFGQARYRKVLKIRKGGVDDLPFTGTLFPDAPGEDGDTMVGPTFGFFYDSRDEIDIPTEGSFFGANVEVIDRIFGSTVSFIRYSVEGRAFQPIRRQPYIGLALHAWLKYVEGPSDVPFYELTSAGGVSTLRGFGAGRSRDNTASGAPLEVRATVYEREVFGVNAALELAPFLDVAKVFTGGGPLLNDMHLAAGLGLRAVVRPQVVAYVDFGYGQDGLATFTGVDYPY